MAESPRQHREDVMRQLVAGGMAGAEGAGNKEYRGVWAALVKVYRDEGLLGYYKGNGTNCIRIAPYSAVQFASYEQIKRVLLRPGQSELDTLQRLTAGACAGILSVMSTYPLDIARTRLSILGATTTQSLASMHTHPTIVSIILKIYREEGGFLALYRGLSPTLLGVAPYVALNFTVYETVKSWLMDRQQNQPLSIPIKLFCGGMAGVVAQTFTYPLDLIRRRFQVMDMKAGLGYHYTSTWDAIKTVVRTEGVRGLFKGCLPNYLKVAPAISVSFVVYEQTKAFLTPDPQPKYHQSSK